MKQLLLLVLGSLAGCYGSSHVLSPMLPKTNDGYIHVGQIFEDSVDVSSERESGVEIVWGAKSPLPASVSKGHYAIYGFYDPTLSPDPQPGAVGTAAFEKFVEAHPTWIEYQCDRVTPAWNPHYYYWPVDMQNPDVLQYLWSNYYLPLLKMGYHTLDLDNAGAENYTHACGHFGDDGGWVQEYSGKYQDPTWAVVTAATVRKIAEDMHDFSALDVLAVNTRPTSYDAAEELKIMEAADLVLDENGVTWESSDCGWNPPGGYCKETIPPGWWQATLSDALAYIAEGGCFWMIDREPEMNAVDATPSEREWAIANYLLMKGNCSYVTITGNSQYGELVYYPELHTDYGTPLDTAHELPSGTWVRHFTHATVYVHPNSMTAEIEMR